MLRLPSGRRVRVLEAGPAEGPPVLLVHGWGCSAYTFRHALPALAAAGHRAHAPDLLGHGLSDKPLEPGTYTAETLTRHVLEILDALELERVDLVGHSLGGGISMRVALRHPERVRRLAALSPVGFRRIPALLLARTGSPRLVVPALPYVVPRWLYRMVLQMVTGPRARGRFGERDVEEYWAPTQFPAHLPVLRQLLHEYDWEPLKPAVLRDLRVPLLLVLGERDLLIPRIRDVEARLDEWFEGRAQVLEVEGVGHLVQDEAPDVVNEALLRFLAAPVAASARER